MSVADSLQYITATTDVAHKCIILYYINWELKSDSSSTVNQKKFCSTSRIVELCVYTYCEISCISVLFWDKEQSIFDFGNDLNWRIFFKKPITVYSTTTHSQNLLGGTKVLHGGMNSPSLSSYWSVSTNKTKKSPFSDKCFAIKQNCIFLQQRNLPIRHISSF